MATTGLQLLESMDLWSKYDSKYFCISEETKEQIALITAADKDCINIHLESNQFQTGSSDCGLFAIAFATDLCFGNNPASYRFAVKSIYFYCQFQADLPPSLFIVLVQSRKNVKPCHCLHKQWKDGTISFSVNESSPCGKKIENEAVLYM